MEGTLIQYVASAGDLLTGITLLVLVFGGVLLGRLAEDEKMGKRFFWAEWPLPESEPSSASEELDALRAA